MRRSVSILLACTLLAACGAAPVDPESSPQEESAEVSQPTEWRPFGDDRLGVSLEYPGAYSFYESKESMSGNGKEITVDAGVAFHDGMPEGQGVHIYRTKDPAVLDYLQTYMPFTGEKTVNGVTWEQFRFTGMGDPYGYVTERDGSYYVFDATWGPENPVAERMFASLKFEG